MIGWTELGEGVFARRYPSLDLEIGVVVCGDGVLLIDTRAHHAQARELRADLAKLTPLPVRWILDTHHHWDHTFGNGVFTDAAIWGHERCAEAMVELGESMRAQVKEWAPSESDLFDEVVITPPRHTFATSVTLTLGGRPVEFHHLGRGHTDNDVIAHVPDAEVVFAGDLIEESAPPAFQDAFPLEWPVAAAGILERAGTVVPGHGAVVDGGFVATQLEELAEVATLARQRHAAGATPLQAAAGGGPYPEATLQIAFARAWLQLDTE